MIDVVVGSTSDDFRTAIANFVFASLTITKKLVRPVLPQDNRRELNPKNYLYQVTLFRRQLRNYYSDAGHSRVVY